MKWNFWAFLQLFFLLLFGDIFLLLEDNIFVILQNQGRKPIHFLNLSLIFNYFPYSSFPPLNRSFSTSLLIQHLCPFFLLQLLLYLLFLYLIQLKLLEFCIFNLFGLVVVPILIIQPFDFFSFEVFDEFVVSVLNL